MSMQTREIVTLQLGHYSNFIGTHWWNLQEASFIYDPNSSQEKEVNHDVLFREGQNLHGDVTYTPRLISVDLKGSLNTLKQDGTLYDIDPDSESEQWTGDVTMHKVDTGAKNEFLRDLEEEENALKGNKVHKNSEDEDRDIDQDAASEKSERSPTPEVLGTKIYNLDDSVHVWSDYLKIHLHPKTIQIINSYSREQSTDTFDVFGYGEQVFKEQKLYTEFDDKLHFFLEECDHFQGLHVMVDSYNGFGGFASCVLEELIDDYGSKGMAVFGCSPPVFPDNTLVEDYHRMLNSALSYERLTNLSSIFVPVNMNQSPWKSAGPPPVYPLLNYKPSLMYHSSAILAASLDTVTLPYRLQKNASLITHLTQAMTPVGRKVLGLYSSFPLPLEDGGTLVDTLLRHSDAPPWLPMSPLCNKGILPDAQSVALRGVPLYRLKGAPSPKIPQQLNNCDTIEEVLSIYLEETCHTSLNAISSISQGCKVKDPFPHVFKPSISSTGESSPKDRPPNTGVESVPMMTSLQSTNAAGQLLQDLHKMTSKLNIRKFHKFVEAGLEEDEFKEKMDGLLHLAGNYDIDSDSDSSDQ